MYCVNRLHFLLKCLHVLRKRFLLKVGFCHVHTRTMVNIAKSTIKNKNQAVLSATMKIPGTHGGFGMPLLCPHRVNDLVEG